MSSNVTILWDWRFGTSTRPKNLPRPKELPSPFQGLDRDDGQRTMSTGHSAGNLYCRGMSRLNIHWERHPDKRRFIDSSTKPVKARSREQPARIQHLGRPGERV